MSDLDHNPERSRSFPLSDPDSAPTDELIRLVQAGKIPNGLLFTGAPGTGKSKAAHFLAKACNCTRGKGRPCDSCASCKKLNADMHPDYIRVDLEEGKKAISIAQIREMGRMISSRPNEAQFRVVHIKNADQMNIQAQNGLLKVLEEPPEQTFFILSATTTQALLPTILSRCRKISFRPASAKQVCRFLTETHGIPDQTARIAVHTLGTDLEKLTSVLSPDDTAQESAWMKARHWLIHRMVKIMGSENPDMNALALSRHLALSPEHLSLAMAVIRTLLRDLALFRSCPEKIVNLDFFPAFEDISQMVSQETILEWTDRFHETERRLASNCGPRLALDSFFLSLPDATKARAPQLNPMQQKIS